MKKKAPRNKTISLTGKETAAYAARTVRLTKTAALSEVLDKTICQDALKALDLLPDACADLLIADPPYNLTKIFGKSTFKEMDFDAYKLWLDKWLAKTVRLLKDDASVYICADWKTSIAIPEIAGKYFILQNRISWEREKGRGALNNWKNCLEDIWFFTKSRNYKFNLDAVKVQRPVIAPYRDEAGRPKDWVDDGKGRYRLTAPSNVWTDISIPFWSMPENTPHPTQKPEKLIAKLILASSNAGDVFSTRFSVREQLPLRQRNSGGTTSASNAKKNMPPLPKNGWKTPMQTVAFRVLKTASSKREILPENLLITKYL